MPFIGNQPALAYTSFAKQDFTTSATTSYSLDNAVTSANELALFINFVRQEPTTAYSASGTSLTLTSATSATDDMYCVFLGKAVQTVNPPSGSVGTAQLVDGAVTGAKLASGVGGKVLQVVNATDSTNRATTSTSFVTASNTLSVNITPSSTSNKILILTNVVGRGAVAASNIYLTIYKNSTNLGDSTLGFATDYNGEITFMSGAYLDSPNTVSATTYQVYFRSGGGNSVNIGNGSMQTITVMEISA